ncbi:unnamed protein product [Peniophora sp. CBMAI 1063]|nr:unnamed protein product [Peniophora sp. CBMAI 1063]
MLFGALLAATSVLALSSLTWYLAFHRLSRFPGPKLAALTDWYATYYEVVKDGGLVTKLASLHARYGPVVRIAPNRLHFATLEAYTDIYVRGSTFTKDPRFYDGFCEKESSFGHVDPRAARARRDVLFPLFSRKAILNAEQMVLHKVEVLLDRILENGRDGAAVHVHRALRSFSLDVVIAYCFADEACTIDASGFEHPLVLAQEALFPRVLIFANFPWIFDILTFSTRAMEWMRRTFGATDGDSTVVAGFSKAVQQIDRLLAEPGRLELEQRETVFHHLLTPRPEKGIYGAVPSRQSLIDEAAALIGAGGDTVANTVAFGAFHILEDSSVRTKLVSELDRLWSESGSVGLQQLEKLPYLTAVIKESLRVSHGVVHPAPRIVCPSDTVIDGHVVPAGSIVSMGSTFVHLNADVFPEPHSFRPERWLQHDAPRLDQYLVAFSKGQRSCLGINLAWCEMYLLFGYLFRFLDIEIAPGTIADYRHYKSHFIPTIPEERMLRCVVRRRAE